MYEELDIDLGVKVFFDNSINFSFFLRRMLLIFYKPPFLLLSSKYFLNSLMI
jgi:hypothetical protein